MFFTPALIFFLGMGFNQRSLNKAHGSVLNIIRQPSRLAAQTSYMQLFQPKPGSVSPSIFLYLSNLSCIYPLVLTGIHIRLVRVCFGFVPSGTFLSWQNKKNSYLRIECIHFQYVDFHMFGSSVLETPTDMFTSACFSVDKALEYISSDQNSK